MRSLIASIGSLIIEYPYYKGDNAVLFNLIQLLLFKPFSSAGIIDTAEVELNSSGVFHNPYMA